MPASSACIRIPPRILHFSAIHSHGGSTAAFYMDIVLVERIVSGIYFTPANSTHQSSLCSLALIVKSAFCEAVSFIVTATNGSYPLFLGKCLFGLDHTKNLMKFSP